MDKYVVDHQYNTRTILTKNQNKQDKVYNPWTITEQNESNSEWLNLFILLEFFT